MAQWWETPAASLNPPEPVPPQTPNTPSFGAQDNPYLRSALSTYQQMRDQSRANLTPATAAPPPVAPVEPPPKEEGWASKIGGTILTPIAETLTQMGPALYNVADAASGGYLDEGRRRLQAGVQNLLGDDVKWQQIATMAEGAARVKAPLEHYESEGLKAGRQQLSQAQGVGESLKTVATNPYLLAGMVAESLPWMAGIAGPAKAAATAAFEGALAKGATQAVAEAAAKTAATRASIAGNFAISGGTSGLSAQERIYGMSEAELANSPAYQQLRQQGLDHRAAQESLARSANVKTTAVAGALGAGATAVLGGGLEAQIAQRLAGVAGPSQGVIKNVLGGAAREGAEEYLQSGGERLGENIGLQAVDPTLTPMTRVFEDAAVGALVGAVAGGTFGAFGDTDRSRQGRTGQDATQRADLARVALADLDEPRLAAAAEQARKVLVDNPRMPARQRQALESALGHLDADLQGRANGEGLRQVLADPAQLQTLRGQATLAGMADDARVSQLNDEELMTAAEQAVAMAQTPALGRGLQQQFTEVAQAYAGHLKARQQLANLDAALQADPTVAPSLAARITQAATGQPKKGITPEYSRASLDDTELTRHLTAADRLLSQHGERLNEEQRTRLTDARVALQAEREQRAANPDWQARNAQIIQANDPREVRLRQSFAKNPEKTVARLTANDAPLIDTLIQSFASRAENYTQTGFPAPEEITRPLTLLQARKAALATEATQQQQATEKKRQTDYLQQQQAPVPTLADALNLTPTNADPLGDWLSQRANIADEQGQMLKRTLAALQSPPDDPAQQQRAQESRRLQAARLTGELIQQGVVEQADRAQTQADIDAWIGSGGRPRTSGVIGQMGQPLGNPQAEPAPQGSQELSRLLGPDTSPAPATPAAPSQPQSLDDFLQRPSTANAVPAAPGRAEGALPSGSNELDRLLGPAPTPQTAPTTTPQQPQSLGDLLQRDSTAGNVPTAPMTAQGPIAAPAAPAPRPKMTQAEVKATQASAQGRQDQARGEQSDSVGSTITPDTPYDDLVRMAYAGEEARRRLSDLPFALERDVRLFAQTGQPATPKAVRAWLETQGTIGAVSDLVSKILKHQKYAQAVLVEGLALPELNRREQALRDRREQQERGKSAPAPDLQAASEKSTPASAPAPKPSPENANEKGQAKTETLLNTEPADTRLLSSETPAELKARKAAEEKAADEKAPPVADKPATPPTAVDRTPADRWAALSVADRQSLLQTIGRSKKDAASVAQRDWSLISVKDKTAMQKVWEQTPPPPVADQNTPTAEQAMRDAFNTVTQGAIQFNQWYPVTVTHNGATRHFMGSIRTIPSAPQQARGILQTIHFARLKVGRQMDGEPLELRVHSYTLNGANKLIDRPSKPASQEAIDLWRNAGFEVPVVPSTEPTPPLLSSETPAELKARQAAEEKAAQQKTAKEKAADEKAAADRERKSFTLAGSDRPADVTMSQGQTNMLDAMDGKAPARPAEYGANNTLVTADRAAELRKKLRAKFGQLNAGIDPEIVAMGTELAVFHLEAGARKFTQFVQAMANDLGLTVEALRPYLRGWYNGARDMMEDSGRDVSAMDTSDQVKAALATLAAPVEVDMFGDLVPASHRIAKLETVEIPLDQLKLSEDVPQFKSGANAKSGVVEPLGGTFDRTGVAPIQVWKRLNGDLEVISGRHRLDLARRSGEKTIPAQIHNEADGFNAKKAGIIDAELNIRDGQGKVKDYVDYFINSKISEEEANLRGLISRFIGKTAFRIANDGSAELIASHRANALSDEAANSIALAAPGNSRLQAVAIKAVLEGKSIIQAVNTLQAVKALASEQGDSTGDMFGLDDSAMREAEQMATIASRRQRQLSERLAAIQGAAKRPDLARKEGVDVKNPKAIQAKITEIKREREAWDRWSTNPDLIASIRDELKPGQKTPVAATQKPAEKQAAPSTAVVDIAAKDEARKQAILGHLTKLGWKPDGSQLSWNIGGAPKGGELNPFGNRLATVEIRSGFVSLLRNNGMDDPVYMVKHSISEGVSPQTIAQQFHAKVMAITAPENRAKNELKLRGGERPIIPDQVRRRADQLLLPITEAIQAIRSARALGSQGRYAAEAWALRRDAVARSANKIATLIKSIPDPANREALRLTLADQWPDSFVTPQEAAYFGDDRSADIAPPLWARTAKPNTPTGQNNETSTRQSVESRGENRPAGNGMGQGDVQPDGAGVGRGDEPGGTTDAGLGSSEQGDAGVPDNDPAVSGTKGAGRVHQPDGEPGPAERVPERGDSGRGGDPGRARVQSEPRRNETTAVDAGTPNAQLALDAPTEPALEVVPVPRPDFAAKKEAQRQAASLAVIPGDLDNIRATLPFLLPEQQEDVLKAEQRFEKHNGMLFTNGTGSGKTFTGLGVIARMVRQGKSNGIIVVPSQSKVEDWIRDGVNLGLKVSALPDTRTAGEGLVITTYANYAANDALNKRNWDFIVYDEAHKLASSQTGDSTVYQNRHEQTALLPDGILNRAQSLLSDKEKITQKRHNEILKEHNSLRHGRDLTEEEKAEKKRINLKLIQLEDDLEALPKPKILFLSATPFAYHDNLDYAAGLLFDWGPKPESRGYNTPNARQAFMMLHFGYRMRNGKLTKPEADVNVDLMERRFFEGLRRSGAVSGRKLVIEQDYSREFIEINNTLGHGLDRGINILMGYSDEGRDAKGNRRFPNLGAELSKQLDFLSKTRLLEGIKAKSAAERAQQHIAMGRKVVVFHDYIEGNPRHPFLFAERPLRADDDAVLRSEKTVWNQQVLEFNREFPELAQLPINNLAPVIPTFMKAFGAQVRLFNGRISTQARAQALRDFNADGSDVQVLVVQRDAGKEGISLHDVSGQHQRVLMDLGLPTAPTEAIQTEGRIYRYGQASNAIIEYLKTNTSFEQHLFGSRVAARARTAENLAMGDEARNLERAFIEAYLNSHHDAPQANQGQGGKANDARVNGGDPYDNAISFYFANRKKTARDKSREGTDYYATPEPIGFKMVEWADLKPNESALEPSAGHGAIARFFPEDTQNSFIEPSRELMTLLEVNARGKVMNDTFENLHINNKYDAIVMNPPFGTGGATAIAHLEKAAGHLREGGRIVVLLPEGPAADKKLEKFLFGEKKPIKPLVTHPTLGPLYFGDTVTIEAFGTKNTFVLNSVVDGRFLREKDTPASGSINMIAATAVEPTGQRAIQSIADSLYPVADIGLPAVTFQRAGTSVKTHVLVLEKHNDPQSAPPRMARMDMAGETIKELFEGLRSLSVLPRSAVTRTKDTRADAAKGMTAKAETPAPTLSSGTIPTTLRTTTHAKKSREAGRPVPWFVVTLDQKLGSDAYSQVAALAKKNKGFWSSYRGDGAIPGFQFSTEAAAKAFQSAVREQERYTAATRTDEGSSREVQEPRGNNTRRGVAPSNGDLFASGKIQGQLEFLSAGPVVDRKTEEAVRQRFGTVVESVKSGSLDTGITRVQTPEDAAHVLVSLAEEAQEHMMALVTDRKGNILSVIRHSIGTMNSATVEKTILQGAIHSIQGAADVWLAHNHPSGNISQSAADITITNALWKNLDRTGVEVRGMIVITAEQTASFYNPNSGTQASYPISITEAQRGSQVPVTTRKIRQMTDQPVANDPIAMIEAMKRHSGGMDGILLLDNSMRPVDFVPMTVDQMHKMRGGKSAGAARLYRAMHESNANSFAATMRMDRDSQPVAAAIDNLSRFANANSLTFVDAILGEDRRFWRSAANLPSVKGDQFFAQANASSPAAVTDALKALSDDATVQRLIDGGALQVVKQQSQLPASIKIPAGQRVSGAVDPDSGVVYLIAENIAPGEIEGFLRHEVGVHQVQLGLNQPKSRALRLAHALAGLVGARQILGEPTFNDALAQLQRMRAISKPVQAAYAAAEKAMGSLNQSPELLHEEALAYLVQNHPQTSLAQKIIAAVRAFLYKAGLKINLTENDLQALAVSALRSVAQGKVRTGAVSKGVMGWSAKINSFSSIEDIFDAIQNNGGELFVRWSSGSKYDLRKDSVSKDHVSGKTHSGLSASRIDSSMSLATLARRIGEYGFLRMGDSKRRPYIYSAEIAGTDSDGYQSIKNPRFIGEISPKLVRLLDAGLADYLEAKERIAVDTERLSRITDVFAKKITEDSIRENREKITGLSKALENVGFFESTTQPDARFAYVLGQAEADLTAEEVLRRVEAGGEVTADEFAVLQAYLSGASRALTATGLDAPTFKTWFGASKIKGKTGQPLKMYHGTMTDFNVFDAAKAGASTTHPTAALGFFFTNDRDHAAEKYGDQVMEVYLAIEKPYVMTDADLRKIDTREDALTFRQKLEARGYDGLVFPAETKTRYVAAFRPDQIKRTTNQTYTRGENDIRFSLLRAVAQDAAYLDAVERGDLETAQQMVTEAAKAAGVPIISEEGVTAYKVRREAPPKKTAKAYKLFRVKRNQKGEVFALFVGANDPLPQDVWLDAIAGPGAGTNKSGGPMVKSKLGPLSFRPGWHAGDIPLATHIGAKQSKSSPIMGRKEDEVWAEVDVAADVDYQPQATANGTRPDGKFVVGEADIKSMPENGMYRYKTNPNMTGQWIISGSMKINRILSENEVNQLIREAGLGTMPWTIDTGAKVNPYQEAPLDLTRWGLDTNPAVNQKKLLDPVTYDDAGNIIPLSQRFDKTKQDVRFALANPRPLTPEQQAAMDKIGRREPQGWGMRFAGLRERIGLKLRQAIADHHAALLDLDRQAYGAGVVENQTAAASWVKARLSRSVDGPMHLLLHESGLRMDADGALDVLSSVKGLQKVLAPLGTEVDDFMKWVAGNRAERLMREGRENLFTQEDIAALKTLNKGVMADGRNRATVYASALKDFVALQKSVMDIAEQSGLIDGNERRIWEHDFYVPFYRLAEDTQDVRSINAGDGLVRQEAFKRLKGGKDRLNDLLENTVMNWQHLLSASLKNNAARQALTNAQRVRYDGQAVAEPLDPSKESTKGAVYYRQNGQPQWFRVNDPLVLEAITALDFNGLKGPVMNVLRKARHLLTRTTTISPAFKVANLLRDTVQTLAVSQASAKTGGLGNIVQGWKHYAADSAIRQQMLAGGGAFLFGSTLEDHAEAMKKLLAKGVRPATILDTPAKLWDVLSLAYWKYEAFGDRLENVNRAALYEQLRKQGKSHLYASFQARDLLDFSQSGASGAVRFLTAVVPFLNARIQGLDKLGRAASQPAQRGRFALTLAALTLASAALYLLYKDDDDFKEREEWDRDTYWWFKIGDTVFRIPKPFEVGALATLLGDRVMEQLVDDEATPQLYLSRLKHTFTQTFSVSLPQLIAPAVDVWRNRGSFTQRPIETLAQQRLSPQLRQNANTSDVARGVSTATMGFLSPLQADYLIAGYFGWVGRQAVLMADYATRPVTDRPSPDRFPVIHDLIQRFVPTEQGGNSKYLTRFYEAAKTAEQHYADIQELIKRGETDAAQVLVQRHREDLTRLKLYRKASAQLNDWNNQLRVLADLPASQISTDQRQSARDALQADKLRLAHALMEGQPAN